MGARLSVDGTGPTIGDGGRIRVLIEGERVADELRRARLIEAAQRQIARVSRQRVGGVVTAGEAGERAILEIAGRVREGLRQVRRSHDGGLTERIRGVLDFEGIDIALLRRTCAPM